MRKQGAAFRSLLHMVAASAFEHLTQSGTSEEENLALQTETRQRKPACILSDQHNFHSLPLSRFSAVISRYGGGGGMKECSCKSLLCQSAPVCSGLTWFLITLQTSLERERIVYSQFILLRFVKDCNPSLCQSGSGL